MVQRKRNLKKRNPTVLIVVPGDSEKTYLDVRRIQKRRNPAITTQIKSFSDNDPLKTIRWANKQKISTTITRQQLPFDIIYCVFDHDNEDKLDRKKDERLNQVCSNVENTVNFYSNPCFEIWLQMHFRTVTRFTSRKNAIRWTDKNITGYVKGPSYDGYGEIIALEEKAIENAIIAMKKHDEERNFNPSDSNPSTTIPWLLKAIDRK